MAKKTVITAQVDTKSGVKSLNDLRKEVSAYRNDLGSLERGSKEYQETLDKLSATQSKITRINQDVRASTQDLTQSVQTLSQGLSGIAGGFAAFQGIVALTGTSTEALEKTFVKLQAAIALTQGLTAFTNGLKAANIAFKALNATMSANPILAIVTALALLVTGLILYTQRVKENTDAIKENNEALRAYKTNLEYVGVEQDRAYRRAQAQGRSERELLAIRKAQVDQLLAIAKAERDRQSQSSDLSEEAQKAYKEISDEVERLQKLTQELDFQAELLNIQDETNKTAKTIKTASKDIQFEAQTTFDFFKKKVEDYSDLLDQFFEKQEDDSERRNAIMAQRLALESTEIELDEQRYQNTLDTNALLERQIELDEFTLQSIYNRINALELQIETVEVDSERELEILTELTEARRKAFNYEVQIDNSRKKLQDNRDKSRMQELNAVAQFLDASSSLLGENTIAQKLLGVASATISTYTAAAQVLANPADLTPFTKWANFATTIAIGLGAVKNILSTPVPNANNSAAGTVQTSTIPSFPALENPINETYANVTAFDEDILNSFPRSVLVVEDVNQAQSRYSVAVKESTF